MKRIAGQLQIDVKKGIIWFCAETGCKLRLQGVPKEYLGTGMIDLNFKAMTEERPFRMFLILECPYCGFKLKYPAQNLEEYLTKSLALANEMIWHIDETHPEDLFVWLGCRLEPRPELRKKEGE